MKNSKRKFNSYSDPYEDLLRAEKLDPYEALIKLNSLLKQNNKSIK